MISPLNSQPHALLIAQLRNRVISQNSLSESGLSICTMVYVMSELKQVQTWTGPILELSSLCLALSFIGSHPSFIGTRPFETVPNMLLSRLCGIPF